MTGWPDTLLLGPRVGHTDSTSSRIWIRASDDPTAFRVEVAGHGSFPFASTDPVNNEFGTAIATISGLRPGSSYAYDVCLGSTPLAHGAFTTMPDSHSRSDVTFVTLSCNALGETGAWPRLAKFVESEKPNFLLMIGDQVYLDDEQDDLWTRHLDSPCQARREALAMRYQSAWSGEHFATIVANVPTYMVWDDHDIRDGWGSFAPDSLTLAQRFPAGAAIANKYRAFFEDAREVYYHFQACTNPADLSAQVERAAPFSFRCGRLLVVVLDERTERDFARPRNPVLGDEQWRFLDQTLQDLDPEIDAVAVANGVPLVDLQPDNEVHRLLVNRTDDIELFAKGDEDGLTELRAKKDNGLITGPTLLLGKLFDSDFKLARLFRVGASALHTARDRWSYPSNRPEQERLLCVFAEAALSGRTPLSPRALLFLAGDIHLGALFNISFARPRLTAQCMITSGISRKETMPKPVGVIVDQAFEVAPGIRAELDHIVQDFNFGVTRVTYSESGASIENEICYGDADE